MPRPIDIPKSQQAVYRQIWDELCARLRNNGAGITPRMPKRIAAKSGKKKCLVCKKVIQLGDEYVAIVEWSGKLMEAICSETCLEQLLDAGSIATLHTTQASVQAAAKREAKKAAKGAAKTLKPPVTAYCATCGCRTEFADSRQYQCIRCIDEDRLISYARFCHRCGHEFVADMVQQRLCAKCR